jgi:hypothetical protein
MPTKNQIIGQGKKLAAEEGHEDLWMVPGQAFRGVEKVLGICR